MASAPCLFDGVIHGVLTWCLVTLLTIYFLTATNPQSADDRASGLFNKLFKQGQSTINELDRTDAVNVVMKRTGKSRAESEKPSTIG